VLIVSFAELLREFALNSFIQGEQRLSSGEKTEHIPVLRNIVSHVRVAKNVYADDELTAINL
jgi:hypothetical protein